jgi:branched-chain amino acid transport system substrate-binding protein
MKRQAAPIKIGALFDMVDDAGVSFMQNTARAIEFRFDEAITNGELDRPVQLITRTVDGLPSGTAEGIERAWLELRDEGVLGIIGPGVTDNCLVTQPLAERHGIPTLNFPGTEHSRGVYGFHFQLGSLSDEGPMIVRELIKLGHNSVGVIRDQGALGGEYYDYFDQECIRTGLRVTTDQRVSAVAQDLTAAVKAVKASKATCLVYLGLGLVIPQMGAALKAAKWDPPRYMNTAFMHGYSSTDALAALEGWVGVDMVDMANPVTKAFLDRFEKRFGERPVDPLHTCFYDMATMTVEGLRWAPILNADGFRQGLQRAHQLPSACGGAGTVMGFSPWDRAAYKGPDYILFQKVEGGAYRPYKKA